MAAPEHAGLEPDAIGVTEDTVIGMAASAPAASTGLTIAFLAAAVAYGGASFEVDRPHPGFQTRWLMVAASVPRAPNAGAHYASPYGGRGTVGGQ